MSETILLKGENFVLNERTALSQITPGHLIEIVTTTGTVKPHATAAGYGVPYFAVEDDLQGKGIDDVYAASARVKYVTARRGEEVNAILADGQTAVVGTFLESAGDGTLRAYTSGVRIAQAMEALDLSGSSGADPASSRLRVTVV